MVVAPPFARVVGALVLFELLRRHHPLRPRLISVEAVTRTLGGPCCTYYVWCRLSTMPAFARRPKFSVMNMASLCTCVSAKPRLPKRPAAAGVKG